MSGEAEKVAGKHYDLPQFKETIELIEHVVEREALPRKSAYCIGNAIKYLLRAGVKPEEVFRLSDFSRDDFLDLMTKGTKGFSRAEIIKQI